MDKLVQYIKMDMSGIPKQGLYCYGEASFEVNQAMQEPLEKLYNYENQPDMREKIREYIDIHKGFICTSPTSILNLEVRTIGAKRKGVVDIRVK